MSGNSLVEMKNITKKFGIVTALNEISFKINRGEVHVLLGENGAGKSTLMKILSGVYQPTSGKIIIGGKDYDYLTPKLSFENKISIIYQELSVIDELSIQENLFVGKLPIKKVFGVEIVDYKYMEKVTNKLLNKIGLNRNPYTLVEDLTISEKQQVEIAKALASDADVIIMDEPTTSLTESETNNLFRIIRQLKMEGKGIVYISHKLKELKEIGDVVTVLKDGKDVGTRNIKDVEINNLVTMMVGREIKSRYDSNNTKINKKKVIFEVNNLTRKDEKVKNISFEINEGEVLGFAGLVFFHNFDIKQNISILPFIKNSKLKGTWGLVNDKKEKEYGLKGKNQLNIKCASIDQNITELSGGNQQKVILSKWMMADSSLIIFDEPTKGIDIGSKSEIYTIIRKLSDEGKIIMMVSSEMPELLAVCDKIAVFKEGEIAKILSIEEASEEVIMQILTSEGEE